jgi:hypothetical protein
VRGWFNNFAAAAFVAVFAIGAPKTVLAQTGGSVHGSVFADIVQDRIATAAEPAPAAGRRQLTQRVYIPDFEVLLRDRAGATTAAARTDVSGRYRFENLPAGEYQLCWTMGGWAPGCAPSKITLQDGLFVQPGTAVRPSVTTSADGRVTQTAVWGRALHGDKTTTYFRDAYFGQDRNARINISTAKGNRVGSAVANIAGEFVVVGVPAASLQASARSGAATVAVSVDAQQVESGTPITLTFKSQRPVVNALAAKPASRPRLSTRSSGQIDLTVEASDPGGGALQYIWRPAPGAGRIVSSNGPRAVWEPGPVGARQTVYVLITKRQGGVIRRELSLVPASLSPGRPFAAISGPPVPDDPEKFLSRQNTARTSAESAKGYYRALVPGLQFDSNDKVVPGSNSTHDTLEHWLAYAKFDLGLLKQDVKPDAAPPGIDHVTSEQAAYLNHNDLGFGRRMTMRVDQATSEVFAFVTNYGLGDQAPKNADLAAENKSPGATVAMEFTALAGVTGPVVKFFVFGPDRKLLLSANLDGNGEKYVPNLCQNCHGGKRYDPADVTRPTAIEASLRYTATSLGASFREFDIGSFRYPSGTATDPRTNVPTDPTLLDAFKRLNEFVEKSQPAPAISELIKGWYAKPNIPFDADFFPIGWQTHSDLYLNVVAKSCRTCHVALRGNIEWKTYQELKDANDFGDVQDLVCGANRRPMPHAKITYNNFWSSPSPAFLASFSATDWPALGTCQQ